MSMPKISIIVPVYNVEKYIAECLESLINQTLRDIEIVCVDDCSTDGSVDIVRKYASTDPRIHLLTKAKNSGLSETRNVGIANSSAPYLMFCDSDDFFAPDMCKKMLNAITQSGADLAMCGMDILYEAASSLKESDAEYYRVKYRGLVPVSDAVVQNSDVSSCNKIFKRSILDAHDIAFPVGLKFEDAYFFNVYVLWVKNICFLPDRLYTYRRRANSIMTTTFDGASGMAADHLKIAIRYFEYLQRHDLYEHKYKYFWKSVFVPFFSFVLWHCGSSECLDDAFVTAHDFIGKNYTWGSMELATDRTLRMIWNGTLNRSRKYLFGLVRLNEYIDCKKVRVLGIPVYKVKYFPDYSKHYVLGIQYQIRHF